MAYALADHLGVTGNYSFLSQNQNLPHDNTIPNMPASFQRKNNFSEAGIGYYQNTRSKRVEIYSGYGMGEGTSYSNYYFFAKDFGVKPVIATGKYQQFYMQPSIGTNKKKFNLLFTMRISAVNLSEFSSNGFISKLVTVNPNESIQFFIQPAMTGKFPMVGNLNGVFQLGLNGGVPSEAYFNYVPLQFAIGIQLKAGVSLRSRVY
jgi:hypothetical protein